jgi:hypothetical protein
LKLIQSDLPILARINLCLIPKLNKEIDLPLKIQLSKALAKDFLAELEPFVTKL